MNVPPKIPPDAEHHVRSDFVTYKPAKPSALFPGRFLPREEEFKCPACGSPSEPPAHGQYSGCDHCVLRWVSFGNDLTMWRA